MALRSRRRLASAGVVVAGAMASSCGRGPMLVDLLPPCKKGGGNVGGGHAVGSEAVVAWHALHKYSSLDSCTW